MLFPNEAELNLLDRLLETAGSNSWACRLFKGDITPAATDSAATYTSAEADFSGYAAQQLSIHGNWTPAATANGKAESQFSADIPFTRDNTDPGVNNSVYGFFVTDSQGRLVMVERFGDGPYVMDNNGDTIKVRPTVRLFDPNS